MRKNLFQNETNILGFGQNHKNAIHTVLQLFLAFLSDPSPFIGYPCHSLAPCCLVNLMPVNDANCLILLAPQKVCCLQLINDVKPFLKVVLIRYQLKLVPHNSDRRRDADSWFRF